MKLLKFLVFYFVADYEKISETQVFLCLDRKTLDLSQTELVFLLYGSCFF